MVAPRIWVRGKPEPHSLGYVAGCESCGSAAQPRDVVPLIWTAGHGPAGPVKPLHTSGGGGGKGWTWTVSSSRCLRCLEHGTGRRRGRHSGNYRSCRPARCVLDDGRLPRSSGPATPASADNRCAVDSGDSTFRRRRQGMSAPFRRPRAMGRAGPDTGGVRRRDHRCGLGNGLCWWLTFPVASGAEPQAVSRGSLAHIPQSSPHPSLARRRGRTRHPRQGLTVTDGSSAAAAPTPR